MGEFSFLPRGSLEDDCMSLSPTVHYGYTWRKQLTSYSSIEIFGNLFQGSHFFNFLAALVLRLTTKYFADNQSSHRQSWRLYWSFFELWPWQPSSCLWLWQEVIRSMPAVKKPSVWVNEIVRVGSSFFSFLLFWWNIPSNTFHLLFFFRSTLALLRTVWLETAEA